jgi:hypothetical protein
LVQLLFMGGLNIDFRSGNRVELLADYFLSSLGIATAVKRQDDIGFDFYCNLSDQESGYLTFGSPFMIQVKKSSVKKVCYGNKYQKWKEGNISHLFRNELPFFIGFVNVDKISLSIHDTTGLWQLFNLLSNFICSQVEFALPEDGTGEERKNIKIEEIDGWGEGKGDGKKYIISLGDPVVEFLYSDLSNEPVIREKKRMLRSIISIEQLNIIHRNLGIRGFTEIKQTLSQTAYKTGLSLNHSNAENTDKIYSSFRVGLLSLLLNHYALDRQDEIKLTKDILKYVPPADYYDQLYENNSEVFDFIKELKYKNPN